MGMIAEVLNLKIGTLITPSHTSLMSLVQYGEAGFKNRIGWMCGCHIIVYTPPQIPTDPNRLDNSSCCIPISNPPCITDDFAIQERVVCGGHQRPGFLSFNMPPGRTFTYTCTKCGYYLTDEDHFTCESEQEEYHAEVGASEYFGGFCDGVVCCPICAEAVPYDEVYKDWKTYCEEMRAEREIEDREEDFNY